MRVTVPGSDILTETNPNNLCLDTDESSVLIKEKSRGSTSQAYTNTTAISHGLAYIPLALVWGEDVSGNLIYGGITNIFSASNEWLVEVDSTNVNITQLVDVVTKIALYYIFYDQIL